jgi:uncharacterized protein YdeI (YjbR/CyaY-like superfamily)
MTSPTRNDLPVVQFEGPQAWATWLDEHHATSSGVWLRIAKKASGTATAFTWPSLPALDSHRAI